MTTERCPCCKQPVKQKAPATPTKICYDCGRPIIRSHKWTFERRDGVPVPVTIHRVCVNPDSYFRAAENKKHGVVGYKELSWDRINELTAIEDEIAAEISAWQSSGRKPR